MNNFFCAEESRQANESLIGNAGNYEIYVLIECPPPWAAELFESKAISPSLRAQIYRQAKEIMAKKIAVRPLFIYNEKLYQENQTRLIIFQKQKQASNSYVKKEFLLENIEDAIELVGNYLTGKAINAIEIETKTRDILVCTHGSHDRCCARYGKPFYYQAISTVSDLSLNNVRIWQCSHFGGHRFAPTAIDLPSGRWYGKLDRNTFTAILTRTGDINCLNNIYRGWGLLPKKAQIIELQLLLKNGWKWFDYKVACQSIEPEIELFFESSDGTKNIYKAEVIKDENNTTNIRTGCNKLESAKLPKLVLKSLVKIE